VETIQNIQLSNQEKTLIAMGAAMGAGCRTCADKLYEIAISLNIPKPEMLQAFLLGLDAKAAAVKTMRDKVSALMDGTAGDAKAISPKLASMINVASFTAANSAPDGLTEIKQAMSSGVTAEQIQLCISTGKMVRKNATGFSDQEISGKSDCSETDEKGSCCSGPANAQNASGCSCG
jgi:alkylhydroperoxidase/carboxymuconolactone decarboxylase family protein YurZ